MQPRYENHYYPLKKKKLFSQLRETSIGYPYHKSLTINGLVIPHSQCVVFLTTCPNEREP